MNSNYILYLTLYSRVNTSELGVERVGLTLLADQGEYLGVSGEERNTWHTHGARDRASRALNLDLSKLSQDFRFYFDSILFFVELHNDFCLWSE